MWTHAVLSTGDLAALLPLEEAKSHLDITFADDDDSIEAYTLAALEWVQDHTGLFLTPTEVEVYADSIGNPHSLPFAPFISLTSLNVAGSVLVPRVVGGEGAVLLPAQGTNWPLFTTEMGAVVARYRVGYPSPEAVPKVLIQAAKIVLSIFYDKPDGNELTNQWTGVTNLLQTKRVRNL